MRRLSSRVTPVLAVLLVIVFPVGLLITLFDIASETSAGHYVWMDYLPLLIVELLGTFLTYLFVTRIYKVGLEGSTLHIWRFRTHIEVPLSEVERVHSSFFFLPDFLWLPLRHPSAFGSTIAFMPSLRLLTLIRFTRHPLVQELEMLIGNTTRMAA